MKRSQRAGVLLLAALGVASGCRTSDRSGSAPEALPTPAAPEAAPAPSEPPGPGRLPSDPLPRGGVARLPSFQVEVMEFERGDAAWRRLRAAHAANQVAPPGSEYVIVRLDLTGVAPKFRIGCSRFRVIGTARIAYFYSSQFPPAPALERRTLLKEGERIEGWCVYTVRADERDLILMATEPKQLAIERRYLALEQGVRLAPAVIDPPTSSEAAGASRLAAAPPGQQVHTQDWSVTALEILRGSAARRLVEAANPRNPPPAEGLEFVAVKLRARYRGRTEHPGLFSASEFRTIDGDGTPYEIPVVIDVRPRLSRLLLPGGEHTGWAVFQVAPGDSRAVLRFQPLHPDRERRYFALAASNRPDGSRID
jgi:hypothetical protein